MSPHRFVRCPHCKMPHDAAERVCPKTGLRLEGRPTTARDPARGDSRRSSMMSERPPPEFPAESLVYDPARPAPAPVPPQPQAPPPREGPLPSRRREGRHELVGQTIGGRYRVSGVLGEGGMGTVYDAEHLGLSREVAIKVLSPAQAKKRVAVKRFQQEARAAGAIGHPNICEVYDLGLLDDGSPYLVMEKLVGQTLADRIAKEGGLPFDDVVEVVVQVLSGLVAAHEKGIVHRDIKPENIFLANRLGSAAVIKLLDFGVSKMMREFQTGEDFDLTRTGMVMGTPYYMSPEQARGERNLDGRVDVYACGVVMYEALVGKRPFMAPNYNALLLSIINTSPKPIRQLRPKIPVQLEAVIMRAMARNRDDRYPSAKAFLRELAPPPVPVAEGSSSRLSSPPSPPNPEERTRASAPAPADQGLAFDATVRGTRPDIPAPSAHRLEEEPPVSDGSIDIPIHVEEDEDESAGAIIDDEPTEIIRAPKHRQSAPQGVPLAPRSSPALAAPADRASSRGLGPPPQPAPPPIEPMEDWDVDTMVNLPDIRRQQAPPAARRPFNPDETMKLDSKSDLELLDDNVSPQVEPPPPAHPPPRRR